MSCTDRFKANLGAHFFVFILFLATTSVDVEAKSAIQITPGTYNIYLGAPITEISKIYPVREAEDLTIALYRKFGFGDPDKEARINKMLKREHYEISGGLPEDVKNIRLTTIKGSIYQIAIYYRPEYTKEISWEIFTYHAIKKYGQPAIINAVLTMNTYSFKWSDGTTELVIRKNGRLNKEKTIFSVENYHVFYTHIATRNMVTLKEKQLEETDTAPGIQKPLF